MLRSFLSFALLGLGAVMTTACAETPKHQWPKDSGRLLTDVNLLQGWSVPTKIAPVVGAFDVIYTDQTSASEGACSYAEGPDRSIVICEKGAPQMRTGLRANGPTQAM